MQIIKPLPNPFLMADGSHVTTEDDWQRRRMEIKDILLRIQYGTAPPAPDLVSSESLSQQTGESGETRQEVRLTFTPDRSRLDITFGMDVTVWHPSPESIARRKLAVQGFGASGIPALVYVGNSVFKSVLDSGIAMLCCENNQLEPMEMGNPIVGPARQSYATLSPDTYTWGSIAVWAWGARRVLDYALTLPDVNRHQILVSGHSRNGKAALLAGALDERFAIVNPAGSGCAGAGSYLALGEGCEDLQALTSRERWWAWAHPKFETWAGREEQLPFDQHFLMGLVAPRPLLRTEGTTDVWANPKGTCVTFLGTEPIYHFLRVPDRNGIHFHEGGHAQTEEDAASLVAFADQHLFGIESTTHFKQLILDETLRPTFHDWVARE
jgi:hypothetical protein